MNQKNVYQNKIKSKLIVMYVMVSFCNYEKIKKVKEKKECLDI
ncbi:hypothetical protein HMPREF9108_01015 [Leptotrichia sp. oral taxon 225 str. F0581]|nr:hypothetical protein HMPREF9108_01015 [Leptotrichia sp. oral taxon 225 str. F0581]